MKENRKLRDMIDAGAYVPEPHKEEKKEEPKKESCPKCQSEVTTVHAGIWILRRCNNEQCSWRERKERKPDEDEH